MKQFELEDACIKCGICVSVCPVYRVDPEFPGPKALGPDWYRRYQAGEPSAMAHVDDCTFCQLCESACPAGVPIAHLIAEHKERSRKPARLAARDYILTHPQWLANLPVMARSPKLLARPLGIASAADWPKPSKVRSRTLARPGSRGSAKRKVAIFVDCFTRGFDSPTLLAAIRILETLGFEARPMPIMSHCCGAAAYASGLRREAERAARTTYRSITRGLDGVEALITLNATCDDTLRVEWPKYFGIELGAKVVPFPEFVQDNLNRQFVDKLKSRSAAERIYTHATCRSKVAHGEGTLYSLISTISASTPEVLPISCCGAAGSYAFKEEHSAVARELGGRAAKKISGDAVILTDSGTCAIHLSEMTGLSAIHPAEWMQRLLGGSERLDEDISI